MPYGQAERSASLFLFKTRKPNYAIPVYKLKRLECTDIDNKEESLNPIVNAQMAVIDDTYDDLEEQPDVEEFKLTLENWLEMIDHSQRDDGTLNIQLLNTVLVKVLKHQVHRKSKKKRDALDILRKCKRNMILLAEKNSMNWFKD